MAKKNHKKNNDVLTLRREVEALKAQLRQGGIQPLSSSALDKTDNRGLNYSGNLEEKKITRIDEGSSQFADDYYQNNDASYLIKDMRKTALFSLLTITLIIIVKILNIF